nr:MAG TPA: hypothetical protein [Caudoviricetes sp.]DAI83223.1 MAG TPA: hypothetical protein [Caudoviricetes sp.]DAQ36824.1 MAG TPA: hypothetical protein [Caudoviricetes sp.]DAU95034.1 MAG TPA: hypothetical protein [Caudoviricetes sp.]DAV13481.1 MAG TPA: hypothetical protein [Caudoviricetes sp.]
MKKLSVIVYRWLRNLGKDMTNSFPKLKECILI